MTKNTRQRARAWCFTKFINKEETLDKCQEIVKNIAEEKARYLIYGIEVCPTTGREHLQGYVYFRNARTFRSVKKLLGNAHITKADGTVQENINYCSKEGRVFFFGDKPTQGERTDIAEIKDDLRAGANMRTVVVNARSNQGIQYAKSYMTYHERKRTTKPEVYWIYGKTGTFKSTLADQFAKDPHYQQESGKWWDGYDAHKDVIINDFRSDFCKFEELLRLTDRYPHRVQVKGGYRSWLAERIFITAPKHPREMFAATSEAINQLMRRITYCWEMKRVNWNEILGIPIK